MPSNHVRTITIVGAGGTMGEYFARALIRQGQHVVNAITRPDSDSALPAGLAAVHRIAYDDHAGLVAALRGQDALIITLAVAAGGAQERLVDAAVDAGVPWIMPNEYGPDMYTDPAVAADTLVGEAAAAVRAYIEAASEERNGGGTKWVALLCGFWYEFSLAGTEARYGFDLDAKRVTFFDDGTEPQSTSTWDLCAAAVAALFALPLRPATPGQLSLDDLANRHVPVASFTLSQREMWASLLRVTGDAPGDWTIAHEPAPARFARGTALWKEAGDVTGYVTLLYARMFYPGAGSFAPRLLNDALGLPAEDLDERTRAALALHSDGFFRRRHQSDSRAARETS